MKIVFDMDGTIADSYKVPNWLTALRNYSTMPYEQAAPMWDMSTLSSLLLDCQKQGIEVMVITWLSKESNPKFDNETRAAKKKWLASYGLPYDHFCGVPYGTDKAMIAKRYMEQGEQAILFDDSPVVRRSWNIGATYNPEEVNIIEILKNFLENT